MPERVFKPAFSLVASIGGASLAAYMQHLNTAVSIAAGLLSIYYTFRCIRKLDTEKKNKTANPPAECQPPAEHADYE